MLENKKIVLTSPKKFQIKKEYINPSNIIVQPIYLSICKADLKYYNGLRPKDILEKKLPLVLIHEGIGKVVYSNSKKYNVDDYVCMVPIKKHNSKIENYNYDYQNTQFMGSNIDGFLQKYININTENLIKINKCIPEFSTLEVGSIIFQSIKKLNNFQFKNIAVIGTGSIGFWASLIFKELFNCNIDIIGNSINKLNSFDFIKDKYVFNDFNKKYDLIIEAVGYNSDIILDKAIDNLNPMGTLLLLGVPENISNINIRKIMENGINIITSHRSVKEDFINCINLVNKSRFIQNNLYKIVSDIIEINNVDDIYNAFNKSKQFKIVLKLNL